jgi:hypothetical protein
MKTKIALAVALALGSGMAFAGDKSRAESSAQPSETRSLFQQLDSDRDGYISREEATKVRADVKLDFGYQSGRPPFQVGNAYAGRRGGTQRRFPSGRN